MRRSAARFQTMKNNKDFQGNGSCTNPLQRKIQDKISRNDVNVFSLLTEPY